MMVHTNRRAWPAAGRHVLPPWEKMNCPLDCVDCVSREKKRISPIIWMSFVGQHTFCRIVICNARRRWCWRFSWPVLIVSVQFCIGFNLFGRSLEATSKRWLNGRLSINCGPLHSKSNVNSFVSMIVFVDPLCTEPLLYQRMYGNQVEKREWKWVARLFWSM